MVWQLDIPRYKDVLNTILAINNIVLFVGGESGGAVMATNPSRTCYAEAIIPEMNEDVTQLHDISVLKRFMALKTCSKVDVMLNTGIVRVTRPFTFIQHMYIKDDDDEVAVLSRYSELASKIAGSDIYTDKQGAQHSIFSSEIDVIEFTDILRALGSPSNVIQMKIDAEHMIVTNQSDERIVYPKLTSEAPIEIKLSTTNQKYLWSAFLSDKLQMTIVDGLFLTLDIHPSFKFLTGAWRG